MTCSRMLVAVAVAVGGCSPGEVSVTPNMAKPAAAVTVADLPALLEALETVEPGQTIVLAAGRYEPRQPVVLGRSGTDSAWVTVRGEPGAIIDARGIEVGPPSGTPPFPQDQGAVALRDVHHVQLESLEVVHSGNAGITVRDSSQVRIVGCRLDHTFSSGIAVWGSNGSSRDIEIVENDVRRSNDPSQAGPWFDAETMMMPHEAISVSGVEEFEVHRNVVHHGFKEGIDVKGDSKQGRVHHNRVHDMARQGLYVDAWEGVLSDIEVDHNEVRDCGGAGLVLSAEGEGSVLQAVEVHDNDLRGNLGTGVFVSRFGKDGPKRDISIVRNTVVDNGWGPPHGDNPLHWITGGIYVFSTNVHNVRIEANTVVDNRGFQVGLTSGLATSKRVNIVRNTSYPPPTQDTVSTGWPVRDPDTIVPTAGDEPKIFRPPSGRIPSSR